MKRIAIIGCPGVGKSTFAIKLAAKTKLPLIHLDYYYHQKTEHDYYHDKPAWVTRVKELVSKDKWIMDGNYSSTFEERFQRADTIIFFDFPRRVALWGVLKRRIHFRNKRRPDMPDEWKEMANLEFLTYVWNFRRKHRPRQLAALEKARGKEVIVFTKRAQAEEFLTAQ